MEVRGLGLRGVWCRVAGGLEFGFRIQVFGWLGFRVSDTGFPEVGVSGFGCKISDPARTEPSLPTACEELGVGV